MVRQRHTATTPIVVSNASYLAGLNDHWQISDTV